MNSLLKLKPLFFASILLIVFGTISIYFQQKKENDFNNGKIVVAEVVEKPSDCKLINSKNTYIKIFYKGRYYNKKIGTGYCEKLKKDFIQVKLAPDQEDVFFLDDLDFVSRQKYSSFLIIILGIIILIKSLK